MSVSVTAGGYVFVFICLVLLKTMNIIHMSWFLVLSPLWVPAVMILLLIVFVLIFYPKK